MAELRWHPFIKDWIMIASHRQERPQMPKDWCPFCPSGGKVPEYEVLEYDNDFPALMPEPYEPDPVATDFFKTAPAVGKCEVILYAPEHTKTLPELSDAHMRKLVDLWTERYEMMIADERVKYVFIFENRGDVVGVTMPHPHGQIYGYSWIPKKIELEAAAATEHYQATGECLYCRTLEEEQKEKVRVIFENEHFAVVLPFFTEYPYGVYIYAKRHYGNLTQMTGDEKSSLASTIRDTVGMLDSLFDKPFPYMMCMHQDPVNSGDFSETWHFHIEFFPPMRSGDRQKFNASSETGAWAHCNPTAPEEKAEELRTAYEKYLDKTGRLPADSKLRRKRLVEEFLGYFGGEADGIRIFSSPGRVNLIGEHTDYNGGFVFPAALTLATTVVARPRADRKINLIATDLKQMVNADLDDLQAYRDIKWGAYQLGVADELQKAGFPLVGCDLMFEDKVPLGSGLSSSAAIEVATAIALVSLGAPKAGFEQAIDMIRMAKISQIAEHNFIGVKCGIMDQFASAMGKKDMAIFLDCRDLSFELVPVELEGCSILIANTNKKRSLGEGKYNERRAECETAVEILKQAMPGIECLRDVSVAQFEANKGLIADETVQKRAAHVIYEDDRVLESVTALKKGDLIRFGQLMNESHDSLRDLYEVTGRELDALVDAIRSCDGVLGARMTGAGFGGCAVAIVKNEHLDACRKKAAALYREAIGHDTTFYVSDIGDGGRELSF